jgi:hypothetical protein
MASSHMMKDVIALRGYYAKMYKVIGAVFCLTGVLLLVGGYLSKEKGSSTPVVFGALALMAGVGISVMGAKMGRLYKGL